MNEKKKNSLSMKERAMTGFIPGSQHFLFVLQKKKAHRGGRAGS
nr:hypothetical protein [Bacillus sp. JFL15]